MARDGSTGTYSRAVPPYVFDTIIDETAVNSEMDDIAAALTQSVSKDGQTTMTGNLKMGGNKLTNAGDASAQNEYTTAGQVQKGTASYLFSIGGTANAITAVAAFSMAAYTAGQQFIFVPTANNSSTTPTININNIGALTIKRDASAALVANDIVSGRPAKLYYNGTDMILLNPATLSTAGGTVTGPVVFEHSADNTLVIRDTRNTDNTVVSPIRLEGGDGSGNDITVRAVLDGANGLKRYDINFESGGSEFLFNRDGRLTLGADGSGSTDAVTKRQLDLKANINSPTFTGTPTAPTAAVATNTTQIATTKFVKDASIGWGQTWQDVRGSRAANTNYTNTTGKPIIVAISLSGGVTNDVRVDGVVVGNQVNGGVGFINTIAVVVPAGSVYRLNLTTTFISWAELR